MTGLVSFRFTRNCVTVGVIWRLFATCVILVTTATLLTDRATLLRLSRESVQMTHITRSPYDVTSVKRVVGMTTQLTEKADKLSSSKSDSRIDHGIRNTGKVKLRNPSIVKLYKKYYNRGQMNYTVIKSKTNPRLRADEHILQLFNTSITLEEKFVFKGLINALAKIANENKLDYFLCCGSLLGSFRHHGMIPWDDDMDVMMNSSHKAAIKIAFQHSDVLTLDTSRTVRWKVYFNSSNPIKGYKWKWPFIDLIFFTENSTHIWDMDLPLYRNSCFRKSWIFPTVSRPFWNLWLPAPQDTERVLKKEFNVEDCATSDWNHKSEQLREARSHGLVPCRSLYGRIPFVRRQILNDSFGYITETLYLGNISLNSTALIRKP